MNNKRGPVLVSLGNPLLDMTAVVVDQALHQEFGLPVDGQLEVNAAQQEIFARVKENYPVEYTAGGCALNSSRVFSWVLGEAGRVVFVGGIGRDQHAKQLSTIVQDAGVLTRFVEVEGQATGKCVALVLGACRCLCADVGAANTCTPEHVFTPRLLPLLEAAEYIYVEGYFITHSFDTSLQLAQFARQHNKTFVFNLCGSYVCENHPNELTQLLPFVDILFGYVEEYKTLDKFVDMAKVAADQHDPENISHDVVQVLKALRGEERIVKDGQKEDLPQENGGGQDSHNGGVIVNGTNGDAVNGHCDGVNGVNGIGNGTSDARQKLVVVTKGPSPLLYVQDHTVRERGVPPISPKDIVDTTGAGDSFVGGFLAALSQKEPLTRCLDCGTWTAQQLLRQKGCTLPSYPAKFLSGD